MAAYLNIVVVKVINKAADGAGVEVATVTGPTLCSVGAACCDCCGMILPHCSSRGRHECNV